MQQRRWDIFCAVVDNYGDIGVCWRLARQLAAEYAIPVRLWVDDLASFAVLRPDIDSTREVQMLAGVEVRHWSVPFRNVEPASVVIEAFACRLPDNYVEAMAALEIKPVWINLEYLSAEPWVGGSHGLPSPHSTLPLTTYFFFPGVVQGTGGLLADRDIAARRAAFNASDAQQSVLWQRLGVAPPPVEATRISLFGYRNSAVPPLLRAWAEGVEQTVVFVPNGPILEDVAVFFSETGIAIGQPLQIGALTLHVIPFIDQTHYDELLWACDFNFVRGEDSFARAQWAARPFVWQIYPQESGIHWDKLEAFLALYLQGLVPAVAASLRSFWRLWNGDPAFETAAISELWKALLGQRNLLNKKAEAWSSQLESIGDLAGNLVQFVEKKL